MENETLELTESFGRLLAKDFAHGAVKSAGFIVGIVVLGYAMGFTNKELDKKLTDRRAKRTQPEN